MQRSIYPRNADEPRGGIGKLAREEPSFTRKKAPFFIKPKRLSRCTPGNPAPVPARLPRAGTGKLKRLSLVGSARLLFFAKPKRLSRCTPGNPAPVPARPPRAGTGKLKRLSLAGSARSPFFRKAKTSLSLHLGNPAPVPARPPRAGTGKLKRLSLAGSARGPFLSPERKGPLAKKHPTYLYLAATSCASCWAREMLGSSAGTSSLRIGLPMIVRPVSSSNQTAASA